MLLKDNNRYNRLYIIPQSFVLSYIFVRERSFENVHCNLPQLLSQPSPHPHPPATQYEDLAKERLETVAHKAKSLCQSDNL